MAKEKRMAYLDPGSGSFILQLLIAAILGSIIALRAYFGKIKNFFQRTFSRKDTEEDNE
jgi:hypothetical protein